VKDQNQITESPAQMTSLMDAQMSAMHERDDSNYLLIPIDYKYDDQQVLKEQIRYSK